MYKGKCTILLTLKFCSCFYWLNYIYLSEWGQVYPSCFGAFLALFSREIHHSSETIQGVFYLHRFFSIFLRAFQGSDSGFFDEKSRFFTTERRRECTFLLILKHLAFLKILCFLFLFYFSLVLLTTGTHIGSPERRETCAKRAKSGDC